MFHSTVNRTNTASNGRVVEVSAPQAGQNVTVSALAASEVKLAFDPNAASATREGNNLVFVSDSGGKAILLDFFSVGESPLPTLTMPDGSRVGSADWLAGLYPDMDLGTSASPAPPAPQSSGAGMYSDDAGGLLDGVEKLGDRKGAEGWGSIASRMDEAPPAERLMVLEADGGTSGFVSPGRGGNEPKPYTPLNTLHLHHNDPVQDVESWWNILEPKGEYDYTARVAAGAAGVEETADGADVPDAWNNGDFSLNILADNAAMTPDAGGDAGVVGGVFAANGGNTSINANNIDIDVTGRGFEGGSDSSVVGAVFAQGAVQEGENRWSDDYQLHNAEVTLKAGGDIDLSVNITGDVGTQDHSGITYAAVAASDRAHVSLESGDDVSVTVTDQAGGHTLDAAGVYGIYSGYHLRDRDIPRNEFASDEEYQQYMQALDNQYGEDSVGEWGGEGIIRGTGQSIVDIKAAGNVDVRLDIGSIAGPAAGLQLEYGDVRVTAGGDINIATTLRGAGEGDAAKVSAVSLLDGGRVDLWADGDVDLSLHGDGKNMSVLRLADNLWPDRNWSSDYLDGTLIGKNVSITGTAGLNDTADVNDIVGIEMSAKMNKFLLSAEEKVTVDVTAFHHGNQGAATGLFMYTPTSYSNDWNSTATSLFMSVPDIEIAARIRPVAGAEGLAPETTATALHVDNTQVEFMRGEKEPDNPFIVEERGSLEKLGLIAEGGRRNYGIHVMGGGDGEGNFPTHLTLYAADLDIHAAGGVADRGSSGSYGIVVKGEDEYSDTQLSLYGGKLSVTVENPVESVGLLADNGDIEIRNEGYYSSGEDTPLAVIISCTITDPSSLPEGTRAVAIEALNGGAVRFDTWNNAGSLILLNGDVRAQGEYSDIDVWLGNGSDRVEINGNISAEDESYVSIQTGDGSDRIEINGATTTDENSRGYIEAGSGNDMLIFSGEINVSDSFYISGSWGRDLLVLRAANLEAFEEQFKSWLESVDLESLSCESFIIQGVDAGDAPTWFADLLASHSEIDVQYFAADTNITLVNAADQLDGTFALDGSGVDDLLYLRFDEDAKQGLQNLQSAMQSGKLLGLERLLLDIANGHEDDSLESMLNTMINEAQANGAEVCLRVDGTTDVSLLRNSGWGTQGGTMILDGSEYTVYNHDELDDLYVKLVVTG